MENRRRRLSEAFEQSNILYIMGCHDALSAKIAEQAGFQAIWASGLGISLVHGKNDANELSSTQLAEIAEHMADFTSAPIIVDADTGFGDFNNARLFARQLVRSGVAGMAIEDKKFPKSNSFSGEAQPLEDMQVFADKIRAVRDRVGEDLFVIGRLEGFISGQPTYDTLQRAYTYAAAGIDALIVHSKKATASEIREFTNQWEGTVPLIIIPTTYADDLPKEHFGGKIKAAIWANQTLRAYIQHVQAISADIFKQSSVAHLDKAITPVSEVLKLSGTDQLKADRKIFAGAGPIGPTFRIIG